ncbi:AP2-like ethylene-responsive transcription factor PLT1 [Papaver somniferum]|uniref:AP2-like ethylene-responsive transcription factor PLT1 n=1 Tax=Papaver somniferum TaxID=3469 RepID=UPI000E6FF3E3|nr:AP2-like ethylene-responsive transcription factor PLT1 [Papaver somniferum]XP_026423576.1 AP2-like ethylene-responsive transcription factor PLT1 [Papaver somniferum]
MAFMNLLDERSSLDDEEHFNTNIFIKLQDSDEGCFESSFLESAQSTVPFIVVNEKPSDYMVSLVNPTVNENCDGAPSDDTELEPHPSLADEQAPELLRIQAVGQEVYGVCRPTNTESKSLSRSENEKILEREDVSLSTNSCHEENAESQNSQPVLVSGTAMFLNLDHADDLVCSDEEKNLGEFVPPDVSTPIKSIQKVAHRTSKYHGVTRHFWTGKFEAHLWDNSYIREGHRRKGKQVFLGQYDNEEKAAQSYDLVALKYWGLHASTRSNFPISTYKKQLEEMKEMSKEEFVMYIRRNSCFKKGSSVYRGVTRHGDGRWQARISGIPGRRGLHLGTFSSEEDAAKAYDIASIRYRGMKAFTNFHVSNYSPLDSKESEGQLPEPKKLKKDVNLTESTIVIAKSDPRQDVRTQTV